MPCVFSNAFAKWVWRCMAGTGGTLRTSAILTYTTLGANILYNTGVTIRDSRVEEIRPPIST